MRIFCLTSFTKKYFEPYMRKDQYDFYISQLNGCEKYALTEVFVGRHDVNFEFHVFRQDFGIFRYIMDRESLEARREGNDYIDVEIGKNNGFGLQVFVKTIRIRCVKADSSRKLTVDQKNYFIKYAEKIEEYANDDSERRETAFYVPEIERFNLANPNQDNNRMSDLMNAFNGLCHEKKKRIAARFDQFIDSNINIHCHAANDKRINNVKDFTKTKEIKLFRSKLTKLNPKWFAAANLDTLDLSHVYPFEFDEPGQWKIFANGIKNCQKLTDLTFHDCGIEEIPDSVFEALPESLKTLSLGDNNIKRISPEIERLKNLYSLSVSYNPDLNDDGFPWKSLPETLHMLDLAATGLTQIPADVERLKVLEHLIVGKSVAYIKWTCLPQSLEELTIDGDGKLNTPRSMQRFYLFKEFALRNAGLKPRFFKHLSSMFWLSHVDLSFNTFGKFKCPNIAQQITRLFLNNCSLTKVNWIDIWRCLPSLRRLELRNNEIPEVKFFVPPFDSINLTHLDLENNKIKELDGYFLPDSIMYLNLIDNDIAAFKNIDLLTQLSYLWIDNNELTELPEGIDRCQQLNGISASKNSISTLPKGFENFEQMLFLDLSHNKFLPDNLENCLWNRLPASIEFLKISHNNLGELPCKLSKLVIWKLEANDCHLKHICPRYGYSEFMPGYKNYISVKQNIELEYLSFVPTKILNVPKVKTEEKEKKEETVAAKGRLILTTDRSFRDTTKWKTEYKVHTYDFHLKPDNGELHKCSCCARCGIDCGEKSGIIETYMVMDFTQIVETPSSETNAGKEVIDEFGPGEWKTLVKTKMCKKCITEIKLEVLLHYDDTPLEHKIREKDNHVINAGVFQEDLPQETGNEDSEPFTHNFVTPLHIPLSNIEQPVHISCSELNDHQTLEQYTETDGSIWYGEPQQLNAFDSFYMDAESEIFDAAIPVNNQFQGQQGQHFSYSNLDGSSQPYYSNQFVQIQNPQLFDNTGPYENNINLQNLHSFISPAFIPVQHNDQVQNYPNPFHHQHSQDVQMQDISQSYIFTNETNDEEFKRNADRL